MNSTHSNARVLIVEDEMPMRTVLCDALSGQGYRVMVANDGESGLERALAEKPDGANNWRGYLDKLPNDPWGHPYQYLSPGVKGDIDVFSFGADNKPGGENGDADIGSWEL